MSHLGERLTALVDGELGHDERDRVLAHLAACEGCRAEADLLRRLKGRLKGIGEVAAPTSLVSRLYAMEPFTALDDPPKTGPTRRSPAAPVRRPGDGRPAARATTRRRVPRTRYLLAGAATLAVFGVGTASFAAGGGGGGGQGNPPRVAPSMEQFAIEHALSSGEVPAMTGGRTVTGLRPNGAARP